MRGKKAKAIRKLADSAANVKPEERNSKVWRAQNEKSYGIWRGRYQSLKRWFLEGRLSV